MNKRTLVYIGEGGDVSATDFLADLNLFSMKNPITFEQPTKEDMLMEFDEHQLSPGDLSALTCQYVTIVEHTPRVYV